VKLPVTFRPAARADLESAIAWYEERGRGLGVRLLAEVDRALRLAAEHPQRYPVLYRDVRCVLLRRFPYSLLYRAEAERVVVLAVFHASRDPQVWRQRAEGGP
jgi:plasmid stabilization system protein ParE